MNGYTKGARNEIFALKPAPVQVHILCTYIPYIGGYRRESERRGGGGREGGREEMEGWMEGEREGRGEKGVMGERR